MFTGLCGMMLTGCQDFWDTTADLIRLDGGDAEAQTSRDRDRIRTFVINTNSFLIQVSSDSDNTPTHAVRDGGATEFTMQTDGDVIFDLSGSGNVVEEVSTGDTIIFRPNGATATVTIILAFELQN